MVKHTISAENLGPITELSFGLKEPGVTVLVAPNGSGKTILLEAVQAAARGEGKLPLRDRTKKGKVEAFGATITIGGTCRHTGEFEVTNLEGRFDLAALVDPRIKTPALADQARIKALVSLTGVEAAVDLFKAHESFENFDRVVRAGSLQTDDLIEMARKIKSDYDEAARAAEDEYERETGHADALKSHEVDLRAESDPAILSAKYDAARDRVTELRTLAESARKQAHEREHAEATIRRIMDCGVQKQRDRAQERIDSISKELVSLHDERMKLVERLDQIDREIKSSEQGMELNQQTLTELDDQLRELDQAKALTFFEVNPPPSADEIAKAEAAVVAAREAQDRGALVRQAQKDQAKAAQHRKAANAARDKAARYREAGKATDAVLSSCIRCPQLRVESDGKSARLVADTRRGKSIPYHDLSDGEKWTIAIDIGADQVGEGGLLVISQVGWEGIDGMNRNSIHRHAIERGVYILTAEAATDPTLGNEIMPLAFNEAETEQIVGAQVGKALFEKQYKERMRKIQEQKFSNGGEE